MLAGVWSHLYLWPFEVGYALGSDDDGAVLPVAMVFSPSIYVSGTFVYSG